MIFVCQKQRYHSSAYDETSIASVYGSEGGERGQLPTGDLSSLIVSGNPEICLIERGVGLHERFMLSWPYELSNNHLESPFLNVCSGRSGNACDRKTEKCVRFS